MKTKTMKITGIFLTLVMLVTMLGVFSLTASAADDVVAWNDVDNDGVQDSGEATYTNLSAALTAGGIVKLTGDYTLGNNDTREQYISMSNGIATLDLNGYKLSCASLTEFDIIIMSGTANLTITDSKTTGIFNCESRNDVRLSGSAKLTIAGGIIQTVSAYSRYYMTIYKSDQAVFEIKGGRHYSNPAEYLATNHKITRQDGDLKYIVSRIEANEIVAWNDADDDGAIDSNEQIFSDMDSAINAKVDLKMNSDVFRDSKYYPPGSFTISSTVTIDLNGHSIIASAYCFEVEDGILTIKDSAGGGQVYCQDDDSYSAITVYSGNGIGLVVESGTIVGSISNYGASRYPDAVVLKGGNYTFDPSRYIYDTTLIAGKDQAGLWGIRPKAANACSVTVSGEYYYNGEAITPTVVVTELDGSDTLVENVDYTVNAENNVSVGVAKVTVTFVNDYRGSITTNFTIDCDHSHSAHTTGTDNGNGTHSFKCSLCSDTSNEAHDHTNGKCICGLKATPKAADFVLSNYNAGYDGNAKATTVTTGNTDMGSIVVKYYKDGIEVTEPTNAGIYTVKIDVAESDNYKAIADLEVGTFTISKATPVVTPPTAISGLIYNGEAQALVNAGETTGGKIKYAVINGVYNPAMLYNLIYSEEIPTKVDAKTYTVFYIVEGNDNYNGVSAERVEVTIGKVTPTLTLTSPVAFVLPGNTILLTASASADEVNSFTINAGELYTVDGMKIKVSEDAVIGQDKIAVTVTSVATDNYNAGSATITLDVGMADFSGAIDALEGRIEDLEAEFGTDGEVTKLRAELDALNAVVAKLDESYATDAELATAIGNVNTAIASLTTRVKNLEDTYATKAELDVAVASLDTLIKNGGTIDQINTAIALINEKLGNLPEDTNVADTLASLDAAIEALTVRVTGNATNINLNANEITILNSTVENLATELRGADEALAQSINDLSSALTTLTGRVDAAEREIDKLQQDLDDAVEDLVSAMKKGDAALSSSIASVSASLSAAKTALEKADADNKAALEAKIEAAEATLDAAIKAVQKNLDDAKKALEEAIAEGDAALDERITALNTALNTATSALEAADEATKAELTDALDNAYETLDAAIKAVQKSLDDAKAELEKAIADGDAELKEKVAALSASLDAKDKELTEKDKALETFIIVVCVITGVTFLGSGAFVTWFFIDKKKKLEKK